MVCLRKFILALFPPVLLLGCKSTYTEKNITNEPPPLLKNTSRIYISRPHDATDRNKVASDSGKKVAESLFAAFSRNSKYVYMSKTPQNTGEALESARNVRAEFLVVPTIQLWEDRATEWSGRRDKLLLKIEVIDLAESKVVYAREIDAKGRVMTDGGLSPTDLLDEPIRSFTTTLFRRTETPTSLW